MLVTANTELDLIPNEEFRQLASDEQIEKVAAALEANNIHAIVVETGEEACQPPQISINHK